MIDKTALKNYVENRLAGSDLYLVDLEVSPENEIRVEVDSDGSVDIDECVALSRDIESEFDREKDDYELEVGSSGLTSPFKVPRQYRKYTGRKIEVLGGDGKKYKGMLKSSDDNGFTMVIEEKTKPEGSKRAVMVQTDRSFGYGDIKYARYLLEF